MMKTTFVLVVALLSLTAACLPAPPPPPPQPTMPWSYYLAENQQMLEGRRRSILEEADRRLVPEADNYESVGLKPHCFCILCICHSRRKRNVLLPPAADTAAERTVILGSEMEAEMYETTEQLRQLQATAVIRAHLCERPLPRQVPVFAAAALGGRQYGVMITLDDGRRFMAVKGNQLGRGRETTLIISDYVSNEWITVSSKQIEGSTVIDYAKAGGYSYDLLKDNGRHAAKRMMVLD